MKLFSKGKFDAKGGNFYGKDVLRPGRWVHPLTGQDINMTPQRLENLVRNTRRFADAGNRIPYPKGHNTDPEKNRGFWNGQLVLDDNHQMYGVVEVLDDKHREGLDNGTIDGVSVNIEFNHRDPKGNVYDEVITHICSTNYPVVTEQGGFMKLSADAEGELGKDVMFMAVQLSNPNHDELGRFAEGDHAHGAAHKVLEGHGFKKDTKVAGVDVYGRGDHMVTTAANGTIVYSKAGDAGSVKSFGGDTGAADLGTHLAPHVTDPRITTDELVAAEDAKAAGKPLTDRQKFVIGEHDALAPDKSRYSGMTAGVNQDAISRDIAVAKRGQEISDALGKKAQVMAGRRAEADLKANPAKPGAYTSKEIHAALTKKHLGEKMTADEHAALHDYYGSHGNAAEVARHRDKIDRLYQRQKADIAKGKYDPTKPHRLSSDGVAEFAEAVRPGESAFFEALEGRSGLAAFSEALAGGNPNHDERGRFSSGGGGEPMARADETLHHFTGSEGEHYAESDKLEKAGIYHRRDRTIIGKGANAPQAYRIFVKNTKSPGHYASTSGIPITKHAEGEHTINGRKFTGLKDHEVERIVGGGMHYMGDLSKPHPYGNKR